MLVRDRFLSQVKEIPMEKEDQLIPDYLFKDKYQDEIQDEMSLVLYLSLFPPSTLSISYRLRLKLVRSDVVISTHRFNLPIVDAQPLRDSSRSW